MLTAAAAHFSGFAFGKSCLEVFISLTLAMNRRKQKSNKNLRESIKEIKLKLRTACDARIEVVHRLLICIRP